MASIVEVKNKFSLYLLSTLMHGIVIVYSKKMHFILKDLEEELKKMRSELSIMKVEKTGNR